MSDEADKLNIKELPIPTAQRLDVFVTEGVTHEARERWVSQGGQTTFHFVECSERVEDWGKDLAKFCGIALFTVDGIDGHLAKRTSKLLYPFFNRAGTEANVFQWQPIEKNFVRRDIDWFNERRTD